MAILIVIMMVATAFVPVVSIIGDETASDAATSVTPGIGYDVSVSIITAESGDGYLSDLVYLGTTLPDTVDPTKWVRDDPASGGTGFWYNVNTLDTANYGKILTYGSLMYPTQIKNDIAGYFKDSGGNPLFTTSNYQFIQISYTVKYACNANVTISKDGNMLLSKSNYETNYAAGCYVKDKRQCVLYSIAPDGDVKPDNDRGTYDFVVKCEQKDVVYSGSKEFAASDVKLYGTVIDNNDKISGQVANKIMNAIIDYEIIDTSGSIIATGNTTMITDVTSAKYGKFYVSVPLGSMVKITNVTADGYSFKDNAFTSNPVTQDTDDVDTPISPGQQRASPIFIADQFSATINVTDTASLPLKDIEVSAAWYYRQSNSPTTSIFTKEPPVAGSTPGTVDFVSSITDSNGQVILTYITPETVTGVETKLYIYANDTNAYKFLKSFISDEDLGKSLPYTSFPALTYNGNIYLDLSHASTEVLRAEESSFTVNFNGKIDTSGYGAAPLEAVKITATWLYEDLDLSSGYYVITDDPNSKGFDVSVVGLAAATSTSTNSDGQITVAYRKPILPEGSTVNCYLYIASTSGVFTMDSIPMKDLVTTSPIQLPKIVEGKAGCIAIAMNDIGPSQSLRCEEVTYNVKWTVNPLDPNYMPNKVSVKYKGSGWTEERKFTASRNLGENFIKFNTVVRAGDPMEIELKSDGFTLSYQKNIGSINSGGQQYTATASVSTDPTVPTYTCGPLTGQIYTVYGLSENDSVKFTYMVGLDKYTMIVPAVFDNGEYKATHSISGWTGYQSVTDVVASTDANVYLGSFVNKEIRAVKLVDKKLVAYYDNSADPSPTINNLMTNKVVQVYYKDNLYTEFTFGDTATTVVSVPATDIKYVYETKQLVPEEQTDGAFLGYEAFNFNGYVNVGSDKTTVTVTIKYVASSSLENLDKSSTTEIVNPDPSKPMSNVITYGDTKTFVAPTIEGFTFSGWIYNGQLQNDGKVSCNFTAEKSMGDNVTLYAVYGADTVTSTPDNGLDKTIIAIGVITVVIALLIFVYVIFQSRRF